MNAQHRGEQGRTREAVRAGIHSPDELGLELYIMVMHLGGSTRLPRPSSSV